MKAVVAVDFVHFDLVCSAGDVLPDDHELVELAPHLFVSVPSPDPVVPRARRSTAPKE